MKKSQIFLLLSLFFNVIFIFILASRVNEPVVKELSEDKNDLTSETQQTQDVFGQEVESPELVRVTRVVDGDTIVLETRETLRYIGIDAPEASRGNECFAEESSQANQELVLGKSVHLEKDVSEVDRYQRLLRYVYIGDIFVNEYLVRQGYASVSTYPPDVKYQKVFLEAESEARENNRGLWKECENIVGEVEQAVPAGRQVVQEGDWDCSGNVYNCGDFISHSEAQAAFEVCGGTVNDIHRLDADGDGIACESLP